MNGEASGSGGGAGGAGGGGGGGQDAQPYKRQKSVLDPFFFSPESLPSSITI